MQGKIIELVESPIEIRAIQKIRPFRNVSF
jgi:hypothetical protein